MNDHELDLALDAIGASRTHVSASSGLRERVRAVSPPTAQQRSWLPRSPKWRFQSMFSATKFVVAGAIVALCGGFLLAGMLTQQPNDEPLPPAAASASASPEVDVSDQSVRFDLLPGVDLVSEEVAPGVYRVLGDGVRDIFDRVGQVAIDSEGDVWVGLSAGGPIHIIRLGEPGVSLKLVGRQRGTLGMTAGGAPVIVSPDPAMLFDGEAWRKTEVSEYDACWVAWSADEQRSAAGADGACYASQRDDDELVVRIDADGTRTTFSRAELGLGPEQYVFHPVAGPDGSIWAAVFDTDFSTGIFRGLVLYDGLAWSFIPYEGDDAELCGNCWSGLVVGRDGVVWFGRRWVDDVPLVLGWDGESWGSYLQGEDLGPTPHARVQAWPNGDVWFWSEARWDGATVSLAEPPIPWGEGSSRATAPDGSTWTAIDRQLYIVTPEAVMVTE